MSIQFEHIKECPFCGGPSEVEELSTGLGNGVSFSVGCVSKIELACPGFSSETIFARRSEAVAAWNKRVPMQKLEEQNADMRKVLENASDFLCGQLKLLKWWGNQ